MGGGYDDELNRYILITYMPVILRRSLAGEHLFE